jgi:hypothetical protein
MVHGYCASGNPFPLEHFTDAIAFVDPDYEVSITEETPYHPNNNWSHDEFARRIRRFAIQKHITNCSCIAHSQGGMACLHLHANYWSCLDENSTENNSGHRRIQSVGTPYQGTSLAGELASMGSMLGVGCGTHEGMTYAGAAAWLTTIPKASKEAVHYYTTSFEARPWWRSANNYCQSFTDVLLDDPDDGTTEQWAGQLPGGVNQGHTMGQCHTGSMRDPSQSLDYSRNKEMNGNAKV